MSHESRNPTESRICSANPKKKSSLEDFFLVFTFWMSENDEIKCTHDEVVLLKRSLGWAGALELVINNFCHENEIEKVPSQRNKWTSSKANIDLARVRTRFTRTLRTFQRHLNFNARQYLLSIQIFSQIICKQIRIKLINKWISIEVPTCELIMLFFSRC